MAPPLSPPLLRTKGVQRQGSSPPVQKARGESLEGDPQVGRMRYPHLGTRSHTVLGDKASFPEGGVVGVSWGSMMFRGDLKILRPHL